MSDLMRRMERYETEGANAVRTGSQLADCPYDQEGDEEQKFRWNHWFYGFTCAKQEMGFLADDIMYFWKVGPGSDTQIQGTFSLPTKTAFQLGYWTPRYVRVPEEWGPAPTPRWLLD